MFQRQRKIWRHLWCFWVNVSSNCEKHTDFSEPNSVGVLGITHYAWVCACGRRTVRCFLHVKEISWKEIYRPTADVFFKQYYYLHSSRHISFLYSKSRCAFIFKTMFHQMNKFIKIMCKTRDSSSSFIFHASSISST